MQGGWGALLPECGPAVQKGCPQLEDLCTIDVLHPTFKAAAVAHGVLADDAEYHQFLHQAANSATGPDMRDIFAYLLRTGSIQDPRDLWEQHKLQLMNDSS